ncbi:hypothetical protein PPERSA_04466 [Pseudocohnilembus persalinus]|uniref:C2H2-type domain-containing protein n=1 Tax=Pseudocohnilembus persalinus TaxID=266149 RepID=A0A0V0QQV7_PSEPJ|nr:hypothetical protein PPERSA_04466 [Pseudocohnilembus persalinus]|eukprot:KRX04651.1 hypothetical protein PPERSA_04466 [Pseudocohnilembus persalinus]
MNEEHSHEQKTVQEHIDCENCDKQFQNLQDLLQHYKMKHHEKFINEQEIERTLKAKYKNNNKEKPLNQPTQEEPTLNEESQERQENYQKNKGEHELEDKQQKGSQQIQNKNTLFETYEQKNYFLSLILFQ